MSFTVIGGSAVSKLLADNRAQVLREVRDAYWAHGRGETELPHSQFLRFADRPGSRIIALPASLTGPHPLDGLKWISSFPTNRVRNWPRASGVIILNDPQTGFPVACIEASEISAHRTAASATLAAALLTQPSRTTQRIGLIGAGAIATTITDYFEVLPWEIEEVGVYDLHRHRAEALCARLREGGRPSRVYESAKDILSVSDTIFLATTASDPYISWDESFARSPLIINLSLRDLTVDVVMRSFNVTDDVSHVLREHTSLHRAQLRAGDSSFIAGTLYDVLTGSLEVPADKTVVFSPFGLGVLDLAVAGHVYRALRGTNQSILIEGFFPADWPADDDG